MNVNRILVVLVMLTAGIFVATAGSLAAKPDRCSPWPACKDDGGDPPPPPPTGCEDSFPGFLYEVGATRKTPAELHISSTDGCRTQFVAALPHLRSPAFHMTADRSAGVIVWSEDIENRYIVRRIDFTVDDSDNLVLEPPVTILPLAGEEAPPGDNLFYFSKDIWGDATHDSLYLVILRIYSINSGDDAGGGTRDALVYDLNELTGDPADPAPESRLIFHEWVSAGGKFEYGDWLDADPTTLPDCSTVAYPQFVATCYRAESLRFNPSGTRLYLQRNINDSNGQRWDGTKRIHIDKTAGPDLADWDLTGPELVYTGTSEFEPVGMLARPDADVSLLPSPEIIGMGYLDRSGNNTVGVGAFLNADHCALLYAPLSGGDLSGMPDFWMQCIDNQLLNGDRGTSWQSASTYLTSNRGKRQHDIYRRYVTGMLAGTEELLIENGRGPDTGN